jgi:VanZ family protein
VVFLIPSDAILAPADAIAATPLSPRHVRLAVFLLLGFMFGLAYSERPMLVLLVAIAALAMVEFAKQWVPGRHARVSDFIVNATAAVTGIIVAVSFFAQYLEAKGYLKK